MALETQPVDDKGRIEVPVICATRDFQGAVAETIATLWNVLWQMNRAPIYCQFQSHGYAFCRAAAMNNLRSELGKEVVRGFMIDDDILLKATQQQQLALAIETADKFGWNFISPYRVRDGYTACAKEDGSLMTVAEVRMLKPFDRIPNGGLGFYYGDIPLSYEFHEGGVFGGEDLNFFYENPQLDVRCVDLCLKHLKVMDIDLNTPIPHINRPMVQKPTPLKTPEELGIAGQQPRIKE